MKTGRVVKPQSKGKGKEKEKEVKVRASPPPVKPNRKLSEKLAGIKWASSKGKGKGKGKGKKKEEEYGWADDRWADVTMW